MRLIPAALLIVLVAGCGQKSDEATEVRPAIGSIAYLDAQDGWQGFRFTEKLAAKPYLTVAESFPASGIIAYSPPADSLQVAGIPVQSIRYTYFKDRLIGLNFGTDDPSSIARMEAIFTRLYGPGEPDTLFEDNYLWDGELVRASATRRVMYDELAHFQLQDAYFLDSMFRFGADTAGFHALHPRGRHVTKK